MELQVPNSVQNIQNLLRPHEQSPILSSRHIRHRRRPTPHPFLPLNAQRIALALRTLIMITTIIIIIMMVVVVMAPLAREAGGQIVTTPESQTFVVAPLGCVSPHVEVFYSAPASVVPRSTV